MSAKHLCTIQVAERFQDRAGKDRARWRDLPKEKLTAEEAQLVVKNLRDKHGAARIECEAFEATAMKSYFGLKLIEGGERG